MPNKYGERVQFTTNSTGTGALTVTGPVASYRTPVQAGMVDGDVATWLIENGTAWEVFKGTLSSTATVVSRSLVASSTGSLLALTGTSFVTQVLTGAEMNSILARLDGLEAEMLRTLMNLAELRANQVGTPNGVGDDFTDGDGVDAAGSSNEILTAGKYTNGVAGALMPVLMTSGTTPSGHVVTASSFNSTGKEGWRAFDGFAMQANSDGSGKWTSSVANSTAWLRRQYPTAITVTSYTLMAPSLVAALGETPKTWTFRGSNDGSAWTTLDTQTNVSAWASGEARTYTITTPGSYLYYEVNVTATQVASSFVSLDEVWFWEGAPPLPTCVANTGNPDGSTCSASSTVGAGFEAFRAFDGGVGKPDSLMGRWAAASLGTAEWVQRQFSSAKTVRRYAIRGYYDTGSSAPANNPGTFTLKGSNDGTSWTTLDSQSSQSWSAFEVKYFTIASPNAYTYYRLDITATGTTDSNTRAGCAELMFFEDAFGALDLRSVAYTAAAVPTKASLIVAAKCNSAFTLNTDLTASVTRDGGTTWTQVTLVAREAAAGGYTVYEAIGVDLTAQPSGTSMKWRVQGANGKTWDVTSVSFLWS